jgi:hypothetical protein
MANTPGALPKIILWISCIIIQEVINQILIDNLHKDATYFIPLKMRPKPYACIDYKHLTMPMIHPTTGKFISSYKCLMNDPATVEVWTTAIW